jgi:hypothetical protein
MPLEGSKLPDYYVLVESFREICTGYDHNIIAKVLAERGILLREGKRVQRRMSLPGMGQQRVYHITSKIFETEEA